MWALKRTQLSISQSKKKKKRCQMRRLGLFLSLPSSLPQSNP